MSEEIEQLQAALDAAELALHEAMSHADDTCPAVARLAETEADRDALKRTIELVRAQGVLWACSLDEAVAVSGKGILSILDASGGAL